MTYEDKTLFIRGNVRMDDSNPNIAPQEDYKGAIQLVITDGLVESIDVCVLPGFERRNLVLIPSTVDKVMPNPFTTVLDRNKSQQV